MASSSEDEIEEVEDVDNNNSTSEMDRVQSECSAMVQLLVSLEKEEHQLHCQLEILAREALLCGFSPDMVEPAAPKRRRTNAPAKKKEDS
jgi:hypothetical protein